MRANLSRWMTPGFLSSVLDLEHVDTLLFGDIHLPYMASTARLLVLNSGGVGYNLDDDTRASFMVLEADANEIVVENRRVEYDVEKAVKDVERGYADPVLGGGESFRRLIMGGRPGPFEWRKDHLAFEVEDFRKAYDKPKREGMELACDVQESPRWMRAFFKDPDRIWLELFEMKKRGQSE